MRLYDVVIIGAGVVGSLTARALSRYELDVLLVEKCADVGEGTTKGNSAIVHAGYDASPGTLKAEMNAAGNPLYDKLCEELEVDFQRCGTYVVGVSDEDLRTLCGLYERGQRNGIEGLRIISGEEMRRREPAITEACVGALYAETGGIVDPFQLCFAAAENAVSNGVEVWLETEALGFVREHDRVVGVRTTRGTVSARWVVVSAGLWADELLDDLGYHRLEITPRKGEYFVLDRRAGDLVNSVLFPCPTPISKGIVVTRTVHGNLMIGPNAHNVPDKDDRATTREGLREVMDGARKLVPGIRDRDVIRTFAGLRAGGNTGDFVIERPPSARNVVALAGIESPGLTAAPAIAQRAVDLLAEAGMPRCEKADYQPLRRGIPRFADLSYGEREALIAEDSRYGNVVCRCEMVTEGEVVAACHAPIPAQTYDAIKRRTRVGSGRCQGGFDTPLVLEIMSRELGLPVTEITKKGERSNMVARRTKDVSA
jgi:glycerol-3-phosphate dehydrogenase